MSDAFPVDVVVPIHNARDELRACVESVFRHPQATPFRLVLIDDASTDPHMGDELAHLAAAAPVPVLTMRNETNLGFAGTANRGLRLDATRDVVLLNSDTQVTPGWLDGLARCAASDGRIGTVTPFSNNSTVSSFPQPDVDNDLAQLPPVDVLARAVADAGARAYPDLPSAVGFCMYIRRAAIEAASGFDATRYGRGYGEDNDFSVRVAQAGLRNVLCDDVFVAHVGGRSFGAERQALARSALRALQEQHPGYAAGLRRFHRERPLEGQVVASQLRLGVAARPALPGVLHVLHGDTTGGTRLHVASLVDSTAGHARGYALHCS
jgi:GT2 family glycosyltransferase